ncbi:MAG: hypothetical protein ACH350_03150 [Parachlamydiaceae bacterium]
MNLTHQMIDLKKNIELLRDRRFELIRNIKNDVEELRVSVLKTRKNFNTTQQISADQDRKDRKHFVQGIKHFVFDLKSSVNQFRRKLSTDLVGARNAWLSTGEKKN